MNAIPPRRSVVNSLCSSLPLLAHLACSSPATPPPKSPPARAKSVTPSAAAYVPGPTPDEIRDAVKGHNDDLRQCYIAGTFKDAQLTGTVNVVFTINREGKVSNAANAGSDIKDLEVVACVLDVFSKLEFAAGATTETEVEFPLRLGG